jgi:hypothetical protein
MVRKNPRRFTIFWNTKKKLILLQNPKIKVFYPKKQKSHQQNKTKKSFKYTDITLFETMDGES